MNASYTYEYRKEEMASAAKDDPQKAALVTSFGIQDDYAPVNYWNSEIRERVHTITAGASVQLIREVLLLDATYSFSLSNMDITTSNPNGVSATPLTLANAVANPWDPVRNRLHQLTGDVAYVIITGVRAGVRYQYERYDLDDFAWNQMQPYMADRSVENTTRFVFTNATYRGYEAHVGRIYLAGTF